MFIKVCLLLCVINMFNIKNVVENYKEFRLTGTALARIAANKWAGLDSDSIEEFVTVHLDNRKKFRRSIADEIPIGGILLLNIFDFVKTRGVNV